MRIAPGGGGLIVTVPRGMSARKIRGFLDRHRGWVEERLARVPDRVVIAPGAIVPLRGEPTLLTHRGGRLVTRLAPVGDRAEPEAPQAVSPPVASRHRPPRLHAAGAMGDLFQAAGMEPIRSRDAVGHGGAAGAAGAAALGGAENAGRHRGDPASGAAPARPDDAAIAGIRQQLLVGGEDRHFTRRVLDFFCREAGRDLSERVKCHAAAVGLEPRAITIKDTTSRWGSCTHDRRLAFSWRIVMAPPFVLDYLAAHEVAHFVEMNHGPQFWALCERLCPDTQAGKAWLKQHGSGLHAIGVG
ncbi:M48 family metallopeptidase [Jiella sp. MQZ13P-4]|uniref:M48 family metallopeptidase n=2 Tax=Jiella sonneratiae TaxID=2816856 RepID=A0ABS3J2P4_9HYPH|nr:M48 family metallopeptidase [Jiella sonneratiae]